MMAAGTSLRTHREQIAFFFDSPDIPPEQHKRNGKRSTLYMVRDDARSSILEPPLLPEDQVYTCPERYRRILSVCITLFAGIDLLTKFYDGKDDAGQVKTRFTSFSKKYLSLTGDKARQENESRALWAVRNSLMHSFGLYDNNFKDRNNKRRGRRIRVMETCGIDAEWRPVRYEHGAWELCVQHLYKGFIHGVTAYRDELDGDIEMRRKFGKMFRNYGWVRG